MKTIYKRKRLGILVIIGVMLCPLLAMAQSEKLPGTDQVGDARMLAMGGALRASSSNTSAVYVNPAAMSMANVFHMNLKYQFTGLEKIHNAGVAFVDGWNSPYLAGGLALDYQHDSKEWTDFESWNLRLATSFSIRKIAFLGVTAHYIRSSLDVEEDSYGPNLVPAIPLAESYQVRGFTWDVGAIVRAGDILSVGIVGYNITNPDSVYAPFKLAGGVSSLIKNMLLIEADLVADFSSHDETALELQVGTELILQQKFSLRAGYDHDFHSQINRISAGAGYSAPRFAIDLGYAQDIEFSQRVRIALGLRIFIS